MRRSILALVPVLLAPTMVACASPGQASATADTAGHPSTAATAARVGRGFRPVGSGPLLAGGPRPWGAVGDGPRPRFTLDRDGDGVPARLDCDDSNPLIYPGAPESCDGVDHDCDGQSHAPGSLTFVGDDGRVDRLDASLDLQNPSKPAAIVLDTAGELFVCPTTMYASLDISADVTVTGLHGAGIAGEAPGRPTVDAAAAGSVVRVAGHALQVDIHNIVLRGGAAERGGALSCTGASALVVSETALIGSEARLGGGLSVDGCTVDLLDSAIHNNSASGDGGGIAVLGGALRVEDSVIAANQSDNGAGAVLVRTDDDSAFVEIIDTHITDNAAESYVGGVAVEALGAFRGAVEMRCSESTSGGLQGNMAAVGAHLGVHARQVDMAALRIEGCDMGRDDEAGQAVVDGVDGQHTYADFDGETVECDGAGCH